MEVFQATESDLDIAHSILEEAVLWLNHRGQANWNLDEVAPDKLAATISNGELYLAWVNDAAVGTVFFQWEDPVFWPEIPVGESAYIHKLAVKRAMKGQGLSDAIVGWAKLKAKDAGKKYLRLDCTSDRARLRAHYEGLGFQFHSERQVGRFHVARYQLPL